MHITHSYLDMLISSGYYFSAMHQDTMAKSGIPLRILCFIGCSTTKSQPSAFPLKSHHVNAIHHSRFFNHLFSVSWTKFHPTNLPPPVLMFTAEQMVDLSLIRGGCASTVTVFKVSVSLMVSMVFRSPSGTPQKAHIRPQIKPIIWQQSPSFALHPDRKCIHYFAFFTLCRM